MTDPIADMLTRIRNAFLVKKKDVLVPNSKIKLKIAEILYKERLIDKIELVEENKIKNIKISLKYDNKESVIASIKRISTPGRRIYVGKEELPYVLNGFGIAILSTSRGIMTNREAKKLGVGGEIICEIY